MVPGKIGRLVLLATPADDPEQLICRKLFILTRDDFRGENTLRLPEIREHYERSPDPKKLVILDGSAHAHYIFETNQGDELMNQILRFLTEP